MPKSHRERARFTPVDLTEHLKNLSGYEGDFPPVNQLAHRQLHRIKKLIYTSKATLDTTAGTLLAPPHSGRMRWIQLSVMTAPTGDLTCDLLLNGNSVFTGTADTKPTVPSGSLIGFKAYMSTPHFFEQNQDYLQIQITTVNGATGPLVAVIGITEDWGPRV